MNAAARVLDRLDGVRPTGTGRWIAKCPAHPDRSPSLSIRETDDGRVLLHDHGGCDTENVLAGSDFVIVEPNGNTVSGENSSLGTLNLDTGVATTTGTGSDPPTSCGGATLHPTRIGTVDFATGTFTQSDSINTLLGSGTLIRAGISAEVLSRFFDNAGTAADASVEVEIPLSLSVSISWPANTGTATSSLVVGVVLSGPGNVGTSCTTSTSTTKMEAVGLRPEINPLGSGAAAGTTTDTFSVGYVKGQAQTYQVSVLGPSAQFCSVTQNGSGAVVDAYSGNASAYPTVQVVCSQ